MGSLLYFIRKNRGKTFIKQAIKEIIPDCFYSGQDCRSLPDCSRREGRKCVSAFLQIHPVLLSVGLHDASLPYLYAENAPRTVAKDVRALRCTRAVRLPHACCPSSARVRWSLFHACGGSCFTRAVDPVSRVRRERRLTLSPCMQNDGIQSVPVKDAHGGFFHTLHYRFPLGSR